MVVKAASNAQIWLGGYDLSGFANKLTPELGVEFEDATVLQSSGHIWNVTLLDDKVGFDAFYDVASGAVTERLNNMRGNTDQISLIFGTAQSSKAISGDGVFQDTYPIEIPVEGLSKVVGDIKFTNKATTGYLLQPKETKTSDGNGTGVDGGASSSAGAEAYLHVFACGGDDGLIVKVQTDDNSNFTSATDLITFTTANGITSQKKSVTGAVERYVRANWAGTPTYSGTFAVVWCRL